MAIEPEIQDAVNEYLDDLRESGETNMFGAAPYIQREFGLSAELARKTLAEWMRTFEERRNKNG